MLVSGNDADITVLDKDFNIRPVFAKGKTMITNGEVIAKGVFD